MLSTQEEIYIKGLNESYINNNYKYYLCYTNNPNTSYNQSYYDIYCIYSKNEITNNNNKYQIQNGSIKCDIDTKNTTSIIKQNTKNCESFNGEISIDTKEFIYSNVGNNSDIMSEYIIQKKMNNDITLYSISILFMIILIFLYKYIKAIIRG